MKDIIFFEFIRDYYGFLNYFATVYLVSVVCAAFLMSDVKKF